MYLTSIWLFRCYVWSACSSSEGIQTRPQSGANKNWRLMFNPDVALMAYSDHGYGRPYGRPRASDPATYRSGAPRNQSRVTAGRLPGGPPASPCLHGGQAQPSSWSRHGNSSNIRVSLFSAPFLMASEGFTESGYES